MPVDRKRELAIRLRISMALERAYALQYAKVIDKYAKESAKHYQIGGTTAAMIVTEGMVNDMHRVLAANMADAAERLGKRALMSITRANKEALSVFQIAVQDYIRDYGLLRAKQITDTTAEAIRQIILDAEAEGDPPAVAAKRIVEAVGGNVARTRAMTIAITETHSAATYASLQTAKQTGLRLEREWVSAEDVRTRPSHQQANGQRVGMDEPFTVGGASLMYPGDPAGPAQEVIRCRCIELYHEIE